MKLAVSIKVPELALRISNPTETIEAMTKVVEKSVVTRTRRGVGAEGALPMPKDAGSERNPNGKPLNRTGSLLASIGSVVRPPKRAGDLPCGVVRPLGDRPADEQAKIIRAKASAKQRTAQLRQEAIEQARRDELFGITPVLKKRGGKFSAGRIKRRTVVDQGSVTVQPPA